VRIHLLLVSSYSREFLYGWFMIRKKVWAFRGVFLRSAAVRLVSSFAPLGG
jgi:hypothetical protein